jgi:hypothetical protein
MALSALERIILNQAKSILKNPKLKGDDLRAWANDRESMEKDLRADEVLIAMPNDEFFACFPKNKDLRESSDKPTA